jgi:chemotaxis family two-component system sensor kinase Cph1
MFSFQLEARIKADTLEGAMRMRDIHDRLVAVISSEPAIAHGLALHRPNLQDYIPSSGVALWLDGSFSALGATPDEAKIKKLAEWLSADNVPSVWATDRLPLVWDGGRDMADGACGVLVLSVSRSPRDYIFWFRPEVIQTVTWAGNPNKPVVTRNDGTRLTPRRSFDAWSEQVRLMAQPWSEAEITAAQTLRTTLLEVVLQRLDQVARERELSQKRQELLLAELDHRVKNTLANIQALVQYASAGDGGEAAPNGSSEMLRGFTTSFGQRLRAMAHAHSLLTQSRWKGANLRSLLEEEVRAHEDHHKTSTRTLLTGPEVMLRPKAALALSMAVHELVPMRPSTAPCRCPMGRWRSPGP